LLASFLLYFMMDAYLPEPPYLEEIEDLKTHGRYREARDRIQALLTQNASDYQLYEQLADLYLYEGNFKDAQRIVDLALKLNPESATCLYLSGYIQVSRGNFDRGIPLLERANSIISSNPEILRNL
jgi:tetratricopeptide (TPR) repeat protein